MIRIRFLKICGDVESKLKNINYLFRSEQEALEDFTQESKVNVAGTPLIQDLFSHSTCITVYMVDLWILWKGKQFRRMIMVKFAKTTSMRNCDKCWSTINVINRLIKLAPLVVVRMSSIWSKQVSEESKRVPEQFIIHFEMHTMWLYKPMKYIRVRTNCSDSESYVGTSPRNSSNLSDYEIIGNMRWYRIQLCAN